MPHPLRQVSAGACLGVSEELRKRRGSTQLQKLTIPLSNWTKKRVVSEKADTTQNLTHHIDKRCCNLTAIPSEAARSDRRNSPISVKRPVLPSCIRRLWPGACQGYREADEDAGRTAGRGRRAVCRFLALEILSAPQPGQLALAPASSSFFV